MSSCRLILALLALMIYAGCKSEPLPEAEVIPQAHTTVHTQAQIIPPQTIPHPAQNTNPAPVPKPPIAQQPKTNNAPATRPNLLEPTETWESLDHWCQINGFKPPQFVRTDDGPGYSLTLRNGTFEIAIGSRVAFWRGTELHLGFAPQLIKGRPYIHALDVRKNILPLLEPASFFAKGHIIVIDPGHGGSDNGTKNVTNGHYEKEYTLDVAKRLQPLLAAEGWTVRLTRSNDTTMYLPGRVYFAEQHHADLFLSLHFNSAFPDPDESGLETYCVPPVGMLSTLTRGYPDNSSLVFPNNRYDAENLRYAMLLHRAVLHVNGHVDRGVRRARFLTVLREQNCPAVLIEGGYLSNPAEGRRIADPVYRQRMAEAIADALKFEQGPEENLPIKTNMESK